MTEPDVPAAARPRRNWKKSLRNLAVDALLVVAVFVAIKAWQKRDMLDSGDTPAPAFTVQSLEGETLALEDLRGKRVQLHFWATWCAVCRREFGALNAIHASLEPDEALVAIVEDAEDAEFLRRFAREHELDYPIYLGSEELTAAYRVRAYPSNYFLDPEGRIASSTVGLVSRWEMGWRLDRAGR